MAAWGEQGEKARYYVPPMPSATLTLSIDIDSDPITGSLSLESAQPRGFCGWMELVEAIESVRHAEDEPALAAAGRRTLGQGPGKTLGSIPGAKPGTGG